MLILLNNLKLFSQKKNGNKENRSVHTFPLNNSISPLPYRMITLLVHFSPVKPQPSFEMSIRNVPETSLQKSYQTKVNERNVNVGLLKKQIQTYGEKGSLK